MVTRNPGAQPSEFLFDQIIYIDTELVFEIFISQNVYISDLLITTGWTDTETTNLETGETAILPPVCRGTVATRQDFSIPSVYNKYDQQQTIHICPSRNYELVS